MKTNFYVGRKARVYFEAVKGLALLLKSALRIIILFCAASYMAIGIMVLVGGDFFIAMLAISLSLTFLVGDSMVNYLFERRRKL